MDHTQFVSVIEGECDIGRDPGGFGGPETVARCQDLFQVAAFDVLHGDVHEPRFRVFADIVDGDDAGVVEPTGGARLADESLAELFRVVGVEIHPHGLERHHSIDDGVLGEIDHSHGAVAEGFLDQVTTDSLDRHRNIVALNPPIPPDPGIPRGAVLAPSRPNRREPGAFAGPESGHDPCYTVVSGLLAFRGSYGNTCE